MYINNNKVICGLSTIISIIVICLTIIGSIYMVIYMIKYMIKYMLKYMLKYNNDENFSETINYLYSDCEDSSLRTSTERIQIVIPESTKSNIDDLIFKIKEEENQVQIPVIIRPEITKTVLVCKVK